MIFINDPYAMVFFILAIATVVALFLAGELILNSGGDESDELP